MKKVLFLERKKNGQIKGNKRNDSYEDDDFLLHNTASRIQCLYQL